MRSLVLIALLAACGAPDGPAAAGPPSRHPAGRLGDEYFWRGQLADAEFQYKRLLPAEGVKIETCRRFVRLYSVWKRLEDATTWAERRECASDDEVRASFAGALLIGGRYAEAAALASAVLERRPDDAMLYLIRARSRDAEPATQLEAPGDYEAYLRLRSPPSPRVDRWVQKRIEELRASVLTPSQ